MNPKDLTTFIDAGYTIPFVEDENANITGYGHQDKALFAEQVRIWEEYCNGGPLTEGEEWTAEDIGWQWAYVDEKDDEMMHPCAAEHEGAFPVTTIWGQR